MYLGLPKFCIYQNFDIFPNFVCPNINTVFKETVYLEQLKYADKKAGLLKNILER